jgi:hypothetical protein
MSIIEALKGVSILIGIWGAIYGIESWRREQANNTYCAPDQHHLFLLEEFRRLNTDFMLKIQDLRSTEWTYNHLMSASVPAGGARRV